MLCSIERKGGQSRECLFSEFSFLCNLFQCNHIFPYFFKRYGKIIMLGIFMKVGGGAKINKLISILEIFFPLTRLSLLSIIFFSYFCHIFLICELYSSASVLYYSPCICFYSFKNQSQERFQWSLSRQTQRSFLSSQFLTAVELLLHFSWKHLDLQISNTWHITSRSFYRS